MKTIALILTLILTLFALGTAQAANVSLNPGDTATCQGTTPTPPVTNACTSFTYTAWSACSGGTQTRSVATVSPSGCVGGTPMLSQACTGLCAPGAVAIPLVGGLGVTPAVIDGGVSIAALGQNNYTVTLATAAAESVQFSLVTRDYETTSHIYVSNVGQPACPETTGKNVPPKSPPWFNTGTLSNEGVTLAESYPAGAVFCVTVCNYSNETGFYGIYWVEQ